MGLISYVGLGHKIRSTNGVRRRTWQWLTADRTNDKPSTSQNPPLQHESKISPFIDNVRRILERDHNTSPFTPKQSTQTFEESHHILTRDFAH